MLAAVIGGVSTLYKGVQSLAGSDGDLFDNPKNKFQKGINTLFGGSNSNATAARTANPTKRNLISRVTDRVSFGIRSDVNPTVTGSTDKPGTTENNSKYIGIGVGSLVIGLLIKKLWKR